MNKDKATATPQLVYSARQMFETRLAKYNDPRNLEWDFDDIRDKWERHAFSAFIDLQTVEAERDQLLAEVAELRAEALKGICVYCGYIEQYESLEQKASEEGNAMRVAHIRQCEARPELKLIAFSEQLIDRVDQLEHALRLALSRAQVDRMLELQRQGFTGTIYEAREKGLMPDEYGPALAVLDLPALSSGKE